MKKSTKGAIAAGAAAVLLLGGAGTLAYWTDSGEIDGGTISSGELSMTAPDCDADWVYALGNAGEGETVGLIVPGDTISKECTFTIAAAGDNLEATLETPETADVTPAPAAPSLVATVDASYEIAGAAVPAVITDANDGDTVTATITVSFPFGTDETGTPAVNANDTQNIVATLDAIEIVLTQTES